MRRANTMACGWTLWAALASGMAAEIPRPEHPRPDAERAEWLHLNGVWDFRFDPKDEGRKEKWYASKASFDRKIVVPFCWESKLSGIEEKRSGDAPRQTIGWYRRSFDVPSDWKGLRVWLRFEAVDWDAEVWVNGEPIGKHAGGYTPFAFDISDHVKPGESASVVVRAHDPTDRSLPTGKQVFWYTTTSGIWQTVWLEARPPRFVSSFFLVPVREGDRWSLDATIDVEGSDGEGSLRVESADPSVRAADAPVQIQNGAGRARLKVEFDHPKPWTPESPALYDLVLRLKVDGQPDDVVKTYAGLRTVGRGRHGGLPFESVLLNGEPIYLRGALDQSFNPEGIYTAPSDDFLRKDMELAKSLGLNFLRIHIKPDEPRRLYWADRLGVLIMEDMPNTWAQNQTARKAWEATMREVIARDRNHPAIFAWCLFNETWGLGNGPRYGFEFKESRDTQDWVAGLWREVKQNLDPTRLVEDNSPDKRDHVVTDLNSWHFYIDDYKTARRHIQDFVNQTHPGSAFNYVGGRVQGTEPLLNSEYGAVSAAGGDRDVSWGFRYLTTQLRRHEKIQGYVYTELSDIEWEHNGFVDYDRSPKEFGYGAFVPGMTVADLQGADFVGFDAPPAVELEFGRPVSIPIFVSHYSKREKPPILRYWTVGHDDLGKEIKTDSLERAVSWEPYRVTMQEPIDVRPPSGRPFVGALALELVDDAGKRIAANFVNLIYQPAPAGIAVAANPAAARSVEKPVEVLGPRLVALRFSPEDFAELRWPKAPGKGKLGLGKFLAHGAGSVEYRIKIPDFVQKAGPGKLELLLEAGAKADDEQLDWPSRRNRQDYPQTDARKHPSEVRVKLEGVEIARWPLEDDAADARGVLSHHAKVHHGSHGALLRQEIDLSRAPALAEAVRSNRPLGLVLETPSGTAGGGLAVFGSKNGRYPIDPTILVHTERDLERPVGFILEGPVTTAAEVPKR